MCCSIMSESWDLFQIIELFRLSLCSPSILIEHLFIYWADVKMLFYLCVLITIDSINLWTRLLIKVLGIIETTSIPRINQKLRDNNIDRQTQPETQTRSVNSLTLTKNLFVLNRVGEPFDGINLIVSHITMDIVSRKHFFWIF